MKRFPPPSADRSRSAIERQALVNFRASVRTRKTDINLISERMKMKSLIGEWVGEDVSVMLRLGGGWAEDHKTSMLKGKLIQVGDTGVMLELPKGRRFVPVTAILHISLPE